MDLPVSVRTAQPVACRTAKRDRFVVEFLRDFNGTQAAIRAGYSPRSAHNQACRLMKGQDVMKAIRAGIGRPRNKLELSVATLDRELMRLICVDPGEFFDAESRPRLINEVPEDARRAVSMIGIAAEFDCLSQSWASRVLTLKICNKLRAIELAYKRLGVLHPRVELTGSVTNASPPRKLPGR